MTKEERNNKLKYLITCMKCGVSGKCCDENCPTQYYAGNMGEIIKNLEEISKILEQEPCTNAISRKAMLNYKDCKYWDEEKKYCKQTSSKIEWVDYTVYTSEDFYCEDAERKND